MRVNPLINDSMKSVEFNSNAFFDSTQLKDATDRKLYNVDQFCIPPLTIDFVEKRVRQLKYNRSYWCRQHSYKVFENVFLNNCPFTYIYTCIQLQR